MCDSKKFFDMYKQIKELEPDDIRETKLKRNNNNPEHESFIKAEGFTTKYGAENARNKSNSRAMKNISKNKEIKKIPAK